MGISLLALALALLRYSCFTRSQELKNQTVDDSQVFTLDQLDGIQYSSFGWKKDYSQSSRWNNSLHFSIQPNAGLIYFFQGNAIYYYGDSGPSRARTNITLDSNGAAQQVFPNASELQYQQLIWSQKDLGPGDHYIILVHAGPANARTTLDYFEIESDHGFTPQLLGPTASIVPKEALFVDDSALNSLVYSQTGWAPSPLAQTSTAYFNGTIHRADTPGGKVKFKFNGTAVWYFGGTRPDYGKINVTLDGVQSWIIDSYSNLTTHQKMLWNVTDLEYGEHSVQLTHSDAVGTLMELDFFRYLPGSPVTKHKSSAGPIVGGVVGGVALFILVCFGTLFYLRRRRQKTPGVQQYMTQARPTPPLLNHSSSQPPWGYTSEQGTLQPVASVTPPAQAVSTPVRRKGLANPPPANNRVESDFGISDTSGTVTSERSGHVNTDDELPPPAYNQHARPSS